VTTAWERTLSEEATSVAEVLPEPAPEARPPKSAAWWGVAVMIMTEATIFATLLASYFYLQAASHEWPLGGIEAPELSKISVMTVILLGSSGPMLYAEHSIKKGNVRGLKVGLIAVILMGSTFFLYQLYEYQELTFGIRDNAYASIFYATISLHGSHVVGGLVLIAAVVAKAFQGKITAQRHVTVQVVAMYWHFVDVVWVFVFSSLYLSAHLQ
jgi:cytochrome c oxidase subunit 3